MSDLSAFGVTREETKLSNGVRVVLFKKPMMPISILATFIAGSRFDPPGKEGLAHFTEHMLMSGTPSFPSKEGIADFVANMGGYKNAHTGHDHMAVDLAMAESSDLEPFVKLLSEILTASLFDEKIIENERGAILSELETYTSSARKSLGAISNQLTFQNTEVSREILGSKESIKNISRRDIVNFYEKYINSSNLLITIAGDTEMSTLQDLLEKYIGILRQGAYQKLNQNLPNFRDTHLSFKNFKGDQVNLEINFRTSSMNSPERPALLVLASVLGGGGTGSLLKNLRYKKGLVYSARARLITYFDRGFLGINVSFSKDNFKEVIENICIEISRLKNNGTAPEELLLVKNKIIKSRKLQMQTSDDWVDSHYKRSLFYPDSAWTVENLIEEVRAVTIDEVNTVARKYFTKDNWYLSATGSIDEDNLNSIVLDL